VNNGLLEATPADVPDEIGHPGERQVTRWSRCATAADPLTWIERTDA
jgi:cysteine synthase A